MATDHHFEHILVPAAVADSGKLIAYSLGTIIGKSLPNFIFVSRSFMIL